MLNFLGLGVVATDALDLNLRELEPVDLLLLVVVLYGARSHEIKAQGLVKVIHFCTYIQKANFERKVLEKLCQNSRIC